MALTSGDIVNIVNTVLNKDLNGNSIDYTEFQSLINSQSKLLFAEKLGLPNRYQLNAPIEQKGAGVSRKINSELRPFLRRESLTITGGAGNLASLDEDVGYLLSVTPNTISGRGFDIVDPDEWADRVGSVVVTPTVDDPILMYTDEDSILISPSTITEVYVTYYKTPDDAVFTYTQNATTLLPEYVGTTELEWGDEQKIEIAYRILRDAGVNIERQDAVAYAQNIVSNE